MPNVVHVIPRDTPETGGNATSAERVARGIARTGGWNAAVYREGESLPSGAAIVAWNAVTVGRRLLEAGIDPTRLVVVWTGTDLWEGLDGIVDLVDALEPVRHHVVFTPDARERLVERAPTWADRITVIPPGVEDTLFRPDRAIFETDPPVALIAGGIRSVKRTHWAIDLVDRVRAHGIPLDLWIVGPVREAEEMTRVADRAADRPWIRITGEIERDAMPEWYCRASVMLNTSRAEGVSNALMEAMACGVPVVASDIPGNRALIEDGRTGWLFANLDEGARVLKTMLKHPVRLQQAGHLSRQWIRENHGAEQEAAAYVGVLDRVAALSKASR